MPGSPDEVLAELEDARRYQLLLMSAACEFVRIKASQGDEEAQMIAYLLDDAHTRNETARFEGAFLLPAYPPG
jgi:hypothetical protein